MTYFRMIALFTVLIFLTALGGDSFAETLAPAAAPSSSNNTTTPSSNMNTMTPAAPTNITPVSNTVSPPAPVATAPAPVTNTPAPATNAPTSEPAPPVPSAANMTPVTPSSSTMTPVAPSPSNITPAATSTSTKTSSAPPAPPADTRPIVGKVIWVKGSFTAENPDKVSRSLNKDDAIYLHDRLITDKDSQAQIVFTDDTLMTFRPETNFYIDQYDYQPNGKSKSIGKYIMNLITGGFRTITGLIAKANPPDYRVNTPVATIGVRGTDYTILMQSGQLIMGFDHGTPCATSGGATTCLGGTNRLLQVLPNGKPKIITHAPPEFAVPIIVQPVVYTPPAIKTNASSGSKSIAPGAKAPPPTSNANSNGFCIK